MQRILLLLVTSGMLLSWSTVGAGVVVSDSSPCSNECCCFNAGSQFLEMSSCCSTGVSDSDPRMDRTCGCGNHGPQRVVFRATSWRFPLPTRVEPDPLPLWAESTLRLPSSLTGRTPDPETPPPRSERD